MSADGLTRLQVRVLGVLTSVVPPAVLFGGAALILACDSPRSTRDIDLLWLGRDALGELPTIVEAHLRAAGLEVRREVTAPTFVRDTVADADDSVELDLVADPGPGPLQLTTVQMGGRAWQVPSRPDLLVDKLCALLSRTELRDLQDVQFLLAIGEDLDRAVNAAPRRDAGFSALTLAWILKGWPIAVIAARAGLAPSDGARLDAFRQELVAHLVELRIAGE